MDDNEVFEQLMIVVQNYYTSRRSGKFLEYKSPVELGRILELDKSAEPGDWQVDCAVDGSVANRMGRPGIWASGSGMRFLR